jgi:tripartite-type tricarboxylate transporter receptor subunit TctC
MVVDFAPALQGQINSKQLRVLATSGATRSVATLDVPTADEAGVKDYEVTSWNGLFAPKGTPKEVIDTMNQAMHEVLAMPEVKAQFEKVGVEPHASTPEELMNRLKSDIKKWNKVVAETGMAKK